MLREAVIRFIKFFLSPFINKGFQDKDVDRIISFYSSGDEFTQVFSKIRFWDAPFFELEKLIPKTGNILDLGCGEGLFTNFLGLKSNKRKIIGFELNRERVKEANKKLPNVKFKAANVITKEFPKSNVIIMVHLLHHLPTFEDQIVVLKKAKRSLSKNGKLIVAEVDNKPFLKYMISYFADHFLVSWLFDKKFYSSIFFRNEKNWKKLLKDLGFKCKVYYASKGKPFSHIIFECSK